MAYFITFLEGLVTFVSPCLLPMLPIYVMYFAGGRGKGKLGTLKNAFGFVLGFSAAFIILGAFAGSIGVIFRQYQFWVNIVCGLIVILFGLNFSGRYSHGRQRQTNRIFFLCAVRSDFFYWMDALCGSVSRFRADAGIAAGICMGGDAASLMLFSGPGNPVFDQRHTDRETSDCV